ncbi:hypothetical protein, partial [Nocardia carnea]|uniref:hypothetical protein n=1 Tax=Nocardia carnea TaxID=37328 RepID=UPI002454FF3A
MAISMFILAAATSESSLTNGAVLATGARRRSSSSSSSSSGPDVDLDVDFEGVGVVWGIAYLVIALALLIGGIAPRRRPHPGGGHREGAGGGVGNRTVIWMRGP